MSDYGKREKTVVFRDTDKRHAELKIRLQHDSLSQNEFFRAIVSGYIDNDSRILSYIYDWRETNKEYPKNRRMKTEKLLSEGDEIKRKFGLSEDELESLFDVIEQEHPDL